MSRILFRAVQDNDGRKWTVHLCPSLSIFVHNSPAQRDHPRDHLLLSINYLCDNFLLLKVE
ncbi:MAG: hypothetical protein ACHQUC_07805 [Chlamydiales bacterium]